MNRNRTDVREIAVLAAAEASHCRHTEALPEHLLTAFFIWDERVAGPYRDAAGVRARDIRKIVRRRLPPAKRRPGPMADLSAAAQALVEAADSPASMLSSLLDVETVTELLLESGGDPSAMTVVAVGAYPTCPNCDASIADGIKSRMVRVPVGQNVKVMLTWSCAGCGELLGISPPESGRSGIL